MQTDDSNRQMIQKNARFRDFLVKQNHTWKLSADNYLGLNHVVERTISFDKFQIKVQFNPERMRSSAAKVDTKSIAERKCFLCAENRPSEQESLILKNDFTLLVNPYPIFHTHFTIPSNNHIPQRLFSNLEAMFSISKQMEGYLLFYNGPECGASAPDHLHFQAGETGFLPIEEEFDQLKQTAGSLLHRSPQLKIWAFDHYLRKTISLEVENRKEGISSIEKILLKFQEIQCEKVEPMVNLLCTYSLGKWIIHLFPRKLHRPVQFFETGDKQLLISPASVDFGGVFITPRREDFDKITAADVADIFAQVTLDETDFSTLKETIKNFNP